MAKPILVRIVGDADFSQATKKVGGFGKALGGLVQGIGAGIGLSLADNLASSFGDALDFSAAQDKLGAQLGLTGAEAERLGGIAGSLYANAYGESLDEVSSVVADLQKVLSDDQQPFLESIAENALAMQTAFGGAAQEYVQLAGQLTDQGVFDSVAEGLDFITTSFQDLPAAIQGDLLDAAEEYGTFLASIGFSTEETFDLLTEAAKGGKFELDKTGDALKEFQIRATDMSTASVAAFGKVGLDAQEMSNQILAGGEVARGAFGEIVDGLLSIEDPTEQANAAIALFGTPLEDIGVDKIPQFLDGLDSMGAGFEDITGAAAVMGDELNDNLRTKLESFRRQGLQALARFMSAVVVPAVEGLADVARNTLGPAVEFARDLIARLAQNESVQRFAAAWQEAFGEAVATLRFFAGAIADLFGGGGGGSALDSVVNAVAAVADVLTPVVAAVGDFYRALRGAGESEAAASAVGRVVEAVRRFASVLVDDVIPAALEFGRQVQDAFQDLLPRILPILTQLGDLVGTVFDLIVTVIERAVQIIGFVWSRWGDEILLVASAVFEALAGVIGGALDIVTGIIRVFASVLQGDWSGAWDGIVQILRGAWTIIASVVRLGWELIKALFSAGWDAVKVLVSAGLSAVAALFRTYVSTVTGFWRGLFDLLTSVARAGGAAVLRAIGSALSSIVRAFASMRGRVAGAVRGIFQPIYDAFAGVIRRIRNLWNGLDFSIPEVSIPGIGSVGGGSIGGFLGNLPFFADGNVATGPTLGVFGEYPGARSNPEITTPESLMASVFRNVLREQGGPERGGSRQLAETLNIYTQPGRDLATELDMTLRMELPA